MQTQDIRCNSCGVPLEVSSSSQDIIKCPKCGVVNVLSTNGTDAQGMPIVGALPVKAGGSTIHRKILTWLIENSGSLPVDICEHFTITDIKRLYVSSYLYECDASVNYSYKVGNERSQTLQGPIETKNGTQTVSFPQKYIEYTHQDNAHHFTCEIVYSGNLKCEEAIRAIYNDLDKATIIELNKLKYPTDVVICEYDLSTNKTDGKVKEIVGQLAEQQIQKELQNINHKDLHISDSFSVNYGNSPKKVYLPLIRVTFSYKNETGEIGLSGDAQKIWVRKYPQDVEHIKKCQGIQKKIGKSKIGEMLLGFGSISLVMAGLAYCYVKLPDCYLYSLLIIGIVGLLLGLLLFFLKDNSSEKAKKVLDKLNKRHLSYFLKFLAKKTPLQGVLQKGLKGNSEAFPTVEELGLKQK